MSNIELEFNAGVEELKKGLLHCHFCGRQGRYDIDFDIRIQGIWNLNPQQGNYYQGSIAIAFFCKDLGLCHQEQRKI